MARIPKAFVAGYPIYHSLSPKIHRYWLNFYRISGSYDSIEVTTEDFPSFIHSLKELGFAGGNVTLPHKEQAYALVKKCDEVANYIGAINTLWFDNGGILHGSNTDAYGFVCNLDDFSPGWEKETALVIGAGGASRAVLFSLKERGYQQIILINRTRARADRLARHFGQQIVAADWQYINDHIGEADLIVNTTSIGIENHNHNAKEQESVINFSMAKSDVVVTDIVYTPLMTPFLNQAQKAGLKIVDGIGMLFHQATLGFERWFGIKPQVTKALRSQILTTEMKEKET
ncbi:MAG: shikimate dehydrogenase [Candidatus Tokpelaia sp. JSC188]|nr:MAG: shikimate dehydrogenase [Candidatus Tokpelaia sp. JSC188]